MYITWKIKICRKLYYAWFYGSKGEGNGNPVQYSCLENPVDRGAWWATVHRVTKSWTRVSNFTSLISLTSYFITGEGNGNSLQCSCLENPMDRGAWLAMVPGVAEGLIRLKWLSMHAWLKDNHLILADNNFNVLFLHTFYFLFYFLFIFKLYKIVLVLPNIKMNPPQVYMCSPPWTLLPPPSPYHPSGSSQCTSPKHPVSCIEPGLATRFIHDIIHVSMPFLKPFIALLLHTPCCCYCCQVASVVSDSVQPHRQQTPYRSPNPK